MENTKYYTLLGKISELEERIEKLEKGTISKYEGSILKDDPEYIYGYDTNLVDEGAIVKEASAEYITTPSKKLSKDEIIKLIKKHVEPLGLHVKKASPKLGEGSGILVTGDFGTKKVMIRSSKDYAKQYNMTDEYEFSGWSTADNTELKEYDAYIFSVQVDNEVTFFVFNKSEMIDILNKKSTDSKDRYHFYLAKDRNGVYLDHRDGGEQLGQFVDAWHLLKEEK